MENLAPLFFIDQNEGWTDLQALQVYRYGIQEIAPASVEYLLGADRALARRLADQQVVAREAKQKAEGEVLAERVVALFRSQGWTLKWSTYGTPLAQAARFLRAPHPGFAILDEPMQQNPDDVHRELMLRFLETTAQGALHQLVVFTFLYPNEIERLKAASVPLKVLEGEHFLSLKAKPSAPESSQA